jgi:hypothetical protein
MTVEPQQPCELCHEANSVEAGNRYCSRCQASDETATTEPQEDKPTDSSGHRPSRLSRYLKWSLIGLVALVIFIIILADAVLGMATILYAITSDSGWIFLPWIGLVFLSIQFIKIAEAHRAERGLKESEVLIVSRLMLAAIIGTVLGAIIWPAFDRYNGTLIGIAFGSLLGVATELTIEIIILTRPS